MGRTAVNVEQTMTLSKTLILINTISFLHTSAADRFAPYGFQSGHFTNTEDPESSDAERINDDSFAGGMHYDAKRNLIYFTGITYGMYFDGMKSVGGLVEGSDDMILGSSNRKQPHLANSDCFLGVLKLSPDSESNSISDPIPRGVAEAKLIYARRLGTPQNSESCSTLLMLSEVDDAIVQRSDNKLKLTLLGHVNPTPLSNADLNSLRLLKHEKSIDYDYVINSSMSSGNIATRTLYDKNKGGFFHSLAKSGPITEKGRVYGFIADIDMELNVNYGSAAGLDNFESANTALLGGYVLEASSLVYPVAMTQSLRDPDQLYIVSMHSDEIFDDKNGEDAINPEYTATIQMEADASLRMRPDLTLGGAGGNGEALVGGVPKYGSNFYVKVQQLSITPYEKLIDVEPTSSEDIKTTMASGWGFGFKLNDAKDVRPSCIKFIKGKTPDDDILLLAGTTRKDGKDGYDELDGFVTKLIPPAPSPVPGQTSGTSVDDATDVKTEAKNPTKRIDSTTGRDETVTYICLPPPNPKTGLVTHAFIVGSIANSESESHPMGKDPSLAYILMMKLEDMSTIWKQRLPSIHPSGIGGDVLGESCAVSPDGEIVYLAGTIDGGSVLNAGLPNNLSDRNDSNSPPIKPVGGTSDVFVVAFDVMFGNVMWGKQLGTVHEDKLARGGGVAVDIEGNVVIMGSTRGALQRFRPGVIQEELRLASDIFVMNLSRLNGEFINAPYLGSEESPKENMMGKGTTSGNMAGGLSPGGIAGIAIVSVLFSIFLCLLICRCVRRNAEKEAKSMWDRNAGDDFSFDHSRFGYGENSHGVHERDGMASLRIVRGEILDDDWDDGVDRISKSATWMNPSKRNSAAVDRFSKVFKSRSEAPIQSRKGDAVMRQNISYTKRKNKDNSNFLASLRDEANTTMSKMFNDADTTDPRLDDGASIKSLLTHYREVRKNKLFDGDEVNSQSSASNGENDHQQKKNFRSYPPPPPPRKDVHTSQRLTTGGESVDGLAEFTIV